MFKFEFLFYKQSELKMPINPNMDVFKYANKTAANVFNTQGEKALVNTYLY